MISEFDLALQNAQRAFGAGQLATASAFAEQALLLRPTATKPKLLLGMIETRQGQGDSALARLSEVVTAEPENLEALVLLSVLHRTRGDFKASLQLAKRAAKLRPDQSQVHSNLGLTQLAAQDLEDAARSFRRAIELDPKVAKNHEYLGKALQLQSRDTEAISAFTHANRLAPHSRDTLMALGQIALSQNRTEDALRFGEEALRQDPKNAAAHLLIAGALIEQGLAQRAEAHIGAALGSGDKDGNAYAMIGMQLQSLGRMEEANDSFRKSIEIQPVQGFSYCQLVRNSKVSAQDAVTVTRMEDLLGNSKVNPRGRSFLHFGLGNAYDDLGQYELAMTHFDRANEISYRLKFGSAEFDRDRLRSFVDWTIDCFSPEFLKKNSSGQSLTDLPVFIVGMMRSGTTLTEQILSSHRDVDGAGERSFWMTKGFEAISPGSRFLDQDRLSRLSSRYVEELKSLFPDAGRITDKMPGNYRMLGIIACAFPRAKIIHTRRNPIDTCLSIYFTPNRVANDFANRRQNIVFAYRQYERLMNHWQSVFAEDRLMTVGYEALVANPEPLTREMVAFCDLDWDENCLRPERNERSVITPSVWQVRQPVYTTSVERWRRYEPWLGAFAELQITS